MLDHHHHHVVIKKFFNVLYLLNCGFIVLYIINIYEKYYSKNKITKKKAEKQLILLDNEQKSDLYINILISLHKQ